MSDRQRVPAIEPGSRPANAEVEARLMARRGRISPLYRVLMHAPPIAEGWERLLTAVRQDTGVDPALREMIILRVAVLNRAGFEFDAHVPFARQAGVSDARIEALRAPALPTDLDEDERDVLTLTDTLTRDVSVEDALMDRLQARHGDQGLVELVTTVAAYNMVSRFLVALGVRH
jgi:AhpD family alkylhydroperoxidase